jgi:DNA polymerase III delta prime subunit
MLARIENTLRSSSPNASGRWYFVVDEIDNLSESAQRSLKSLLNSRFAAFVLTTNYASELDRGLLDRCTAIEMNKAPNEMFLATARRMADDMDFTVSDDDLLQLIERCNGSFRRLPDVIRMAARRAAA